MMMCMHCYITFFAPYSLSNYHDGFSLKGYKWSQTDQLFRRYDHSDYDEDDEIDDASVFLDECYNLIPNKMTQHGYYDYYVLLSSLNKLDFDDL